MHPRNEERHVHMHQSVPVKLPEGAMKPQVVFVRNRRRRCLHALMMGPRRRRQLLGALALFTVSTFTILYRTYADLNEDQSRLRYLNPSLPSESLPEDDYNYNAGGGKYPSKQETVVQWGAGRHLQEEKGHVSEIDSQKNGGDSNSAGGSHVTVAVARRIPVSFLDVHHCPACVGTSLCREFKRGNVLAFRELDGSEEGARRYPGRWKGRDVVLRSPGRGRTDRLTDFVCQNWTGLGNPGADCRVSEAIMQTDVSRTDLDVSVHDLGQHIFPQEDDPISIIRPSTCAYGSIYNIMKNRYHVKHAKYMHHSRKMSNLVTTMLLDPLPAIVKFVRKQVPDLLPYFPRLLGSCGNVVVVEDEGSPLENYLPEPWEKRVNLALEILRFVDDLWNASDKWGFVLLDFSYKNFVVLPDGQLRLIAPEKLLIVDKTYFKDTLGNVDADPHVNRPPCNKVCLITFLNQLILTNDTECSLTVHPLQFMYMMASHGLLSDLYTTRMVNFFDESAATDDHHPGGLLYGIPDALDSKMSQLLYECVLESQGGARHNAARMLKRILEIVRKGFQYKKRIAEDKLKYSIAQAG